MTVRYLHKDFGQNMMTYGRAVEFWQTFVRKCLGSAYPDARAWHKTDVFNGKPFYGGNPIYTLHVPELKRALRIIQAEEIEFPNEPVLSAWLDHFDLPDHDDLYGSDELVIALELTAEVLPTVERLIRAWFVEQVSRDAMETLLGETSTVPA